MKTQSLFNYNKFCDNKLYDYIQHQFFKFKLKDKVVAQWEGFVMKQLQVYCRKRVKKMNNCTWAKWEKHKRVQKKLFTLKHKILEGL